MNDRLDPIGTAGAILAIGLGMCIALPLGAVVFAVEMIGKVVDCAIPERTRR